MLCVYAANCLWYGLSSDAHQHLVIDRRRLLPPPSDDIANFLLHYLPQDRSERLPTHLNRVSPDTTRRREESGLTGRRVVALGQSQGASYM